MDRLIYTAMSGAKALEQRQHALSNNLANASTDGFRADMAAFRAVPVRAEGSATTRVMNLEATSGFSTANGPLRQTGRALDVAVNGEGWLAVQGPDGQEAYTRNGALTVGPEGVLQTMAGFPVLGDGGAITIPENSEVMIGADGTVSTRVGSELPTQVGRLKLVNPDPKGLEKVGNGMVRLTGQNVGEVDDSVRVVSGALESSNVNVVESMIGMISVARQFEIQMRMVQNVEGNDARASSLLSLQS